MSLDGIVIDWFRSLEGVHISNWNVIRDGFIESQIVYRRDSKYLRGITDLWLYNDEGDVTDEDDQSDDGSSVVFANMVQISENPKKDVNKTVDVCRTYLTYKRKTRNP